MAFWSKKTSSNISRDTATGRFVPVAGKVGVVHNIKMPNGQTIRTVRSDTMTKALAGSVLRQSSKKK